ncbi:MAG: type II secretion system ATPase GspE [Candidatus Rokubacteria bacterium]|nr:type II secretion system ATPase GspE [Candidatus Rokubacteria bacterium]
MALGDLLIESGLITPSQWDQAETAARQGSQGPIQALAAAGVISEEDVLQTLGQRLGLEVVSLAEGPPGPAIANTLSVRFLREHRIFPYQFQDGTLTVAMADPTDSESIEGLRVALGLRIRVCLAREAEILQAIERAYSNPATSMERIIDEISPEEGEGLLAGLDEDVAHLREVAQEAPVVRLVNLIITRAVEVGASDIHIEPFEGKLRIRYRIDGVLHETDAPPVRLQAAIASRVKLMAKMNIAERRLPQDGRIKLKVLNRAIDLRVSTIPTIYGESVVMRILDRESVFLTLDRLGFPEREQRQFERRMQRPYGIILVTGPTGSGKTTTLYASLDKINSPDRKIITIEDPVEYQLNGVNQIQVKPKIGLTFANGLRHIVRQDPDVILVGEIRDGETADIAIHAALTGHLVFSTLHTNDAAGAVTRLQDMGIESYLIASSVLGILAQRLVRLVCRECREPFPVDGEIRREIAQNGDDLETYRGRGCEACNYTGYRGRTGIYEFLIVDEEVRRLVLQKTSAQVIKQAAVATGMRTLREDGWEKVQRGITSVSEVLRVTQEETEVETAVPHEEVSRPIPLTPGAAARMTEP